jgi:hypothetical protein
MQPPICLCSLQSSPCQWHVNNHRKLRESCFPSLSHCLLTYIKFTTICLYLLNHLITFDCGVTDNQLFYVTQLWICLSHMLPLRSISAFVSGTYQWPCICIARWDSCWTPTCMFSQSATLGQPSHFFTITPNSAGNQSFAPFLIWSLLIQNCNIK